MAIIIPDYSIYVVFVLWIVGKTVARFGGVKIAIWRARGIQFFSYVIKNPSHDRRTYSKKMDELKIHSPLGFEHNKDSGIYFWPTKETLPAGANVEDYIDRWFGGPLLEFREGDSRPMPISKSDGQLMNPRDIVKPYKNKSAADLNRIGQPKTRIQQISTLLLLISLVAQVTIIYYLLFYGQNIACAVHVHGVTCG